MAIDQLVFTYRARGKSFDDCGGFQIAGCSEGISGEDQDVLREICMHYGDAICRCAPKEARNAEDDWRCSLHAVPTEVPRNILEKFPIAIVYDELGNGRFALTRVTYIGLCPEEGGGRFGNFIAHAYVFEPNELVHYDYNPLTLARCLGSSLSNLIDERVLPRLAEFPARAEYCDLDMLCVEPFRDRLSAMAMAISAASPTNRPLLVCVNDWRVAARLCEVLLSLLPAKRRCRTTVTSFESVREWVMPRRLGQRSAQVAAHHVLVCADGRNYVHLRPDEIRNRFAVFDFVGQQYSDLTQPTGWPVFVAKCIEGHLVDQLIFFHNVLDQFSIVDQQDKWDKGAAIAILLVSEPTDDQLVKGAVALRDLAIDSTTSQYSLHILLPHVLQLVNANNWRCLERLSDILGQLGARSSVPSGKEGVESYTSALSDAVQTSLEQGKARAALALLASYSETRGEELLSSCERVFHEACKFEVDAIEPGELSALYTLLLEALELSGKCNRRELRNVLLVAAFRLAIRAGNTAKAWSAVHETVENALSSPWGTEEGQLAHNLISCLTIEQCPDALLWLQLRRLNALRPYGTELADCLESIAVASSRCADANRRALEAIKLVREHIPDDEHLAFQLGILAEATANYESGLAFFMAYRGALSSLRQSHRDAVRSSLASCGRVGVLSHDLIADTIPWESGSETRFWSWWNSTVKPNPVIVNDVEIQLAALIDGAETFREFRPLLEKLLIESIKSFGSGPGYVKLLATAVQSLPLEPPLGYWKDIVEHPPGFLSAESANRLRLLKFILSRSHAVEVNDKSDASIRSDHEAWANDVRSMNRADRASVIALYLKSCAMTGITTVEDAHCFVQTMMAAGEESGEVIGDTVGQLLEDKDAVTKVMVASAFVDCALMRRDERLPWKVVVTTILRKCDKATRRLFREHLKYRFGQRVPGYEQITTEFCEAVGLPAITAVQPVASDYATATGLAMKKQTAEKEIGILSHVSGFLQRFRRG